MIKKKKIIIISNKTNNNQKNKNQIWHMKNLKRMKLEKNLIL